MSLWQRFRGGAARVGSGLRAGFGGDDETRYLSEWVGAHVGVEGFVEPATFVTDVTVLLVAGDGEWTRRAVGERGARRLSAQLKIPVYDVTKTGYPQRMRDHDARRRIERRHALEDELRES